MIETKFLMLKLWIFGTKTVVCFYRNNRVCFFKYFIIKIIVLIIILIIIIIISLNSAHDERAP